MLLTEYNEAEQMELFKEDGRREGVKEGLKAFVCTLKDYIKDFDTLYKVVTKNESYKHVSREEVLKYYK